MKKSLFLFVIILVAVLPDLHAKDGLLSDLAPAFSTSVPHVSFIEKITDWDPIKKDYSLPIQTENEAIEKCKARIATAVERLTANGVLILGTHECRDRHGWGTAMLELMPYHLIGEVYMSPNTTNAKLN